MHGGTRGADRDWPVAIRRRETAILEALIRRGGKAVPRPLLEQDVYGLQSEFCPSSREVRIRRIRRHLAQTRSTTTIETVRGVGYGLSDNASARTPTPTLPDQNVAGRRLTVYGPRARRQRGCCDAAAASPRGACRAEDRSHA